MVRTQKERALPPGMKTTTRSELRGGSFGLKARRFSLRTVPPRWLEPARSRGRALCLTYGRAALSSSHYGSLSLDESRWTPFLAHRRGASIYFSFRLITLLLFSRRSDRFCYSSRTLRVGHQADPGSDIRVAATPVFLRLLKPCC